ncbi:hypothetical protein PLIIFM63780_002583 [Purpureocillium lilacinum]|nr:hypothetical protein PLIIFM63780_002583 [Purpureocillium lilacinum]
MHDHYRPHQPQPQPQPPSPAHAAYHTYPSRESVVKREVVEDPRRPNSTGHAPESLPPQPHAVPGTQAPAPLQPSAFPPEGQQPRHMSFDNGHSLPPTPGAYRGPTFPPPTPSQQPYDSHGAYASEPFYKFSTDKAQADILEALAMMQSGMQNSLQMLNDRMAMLENKFSKGSDGGNMKQDPASEEDLKAINHRSSLLEERRDSHYSEIDIARDQIVTPTDRNAILMAAEEDALEQNPGPLVTPKEPAIPIHHTTLAGLLLNWAPIKQLTRHHVERVGIRHVNEFPISQEQNRGQLIVYGRGEASHPSRQPKEAPDHGQLDIADDSSDMASPSPAADWGHVGGLSPAEQVEYRGGVLAFDGNPDYTESKVWMYVESFKENILNMHPIIQPKVLQDWVRHFLDSLPRVQPKTSKPQASKTAFAVRAPVETTGSKRKRSPGPEHDGSTTTGPVRAGKPDRSIHSALVLTILALGKICLYRDNVPDALHHSEQVLHGSPFSRNGVPPSPMQGSPPSHSTHSQSSGLASPKEPERLPPSRRSSIHGQGGVRHGYDLKKNYEVVPGLEYFAVATDILGNHIGSYNNMKNVYANIFAGLYHGQLARPLESFAFIHAAGHKLQVLMRPSMSKLKEIKDKQTFITDIKYNQLALAFWTCLQLESDLIAELTLPPSGLLGYEEAMPHPNLSLIDGFDQRVLDSYPGQLYLRTHLNSIHRMFYAPDDDPASARLQTETKFMNVSVVADSVSGMNWIAPRFAFQETDPPADDILGARLRGKYWGAQVITYRPFIRMILEFNYWRAHQSGPNVLPVPEFRKGIVYPTIAPDAKSSKDLDAELVSLAIKGIKALVESTRAFHGLGEQRPIITNVFGTAHAQWGNLLVLAAAYVDPTLHDSVDGQLLKTLFEKTIHFLRQSATTTSALRLDMHILEGLYQDLFVHSMNEPKPNSSFSSSVSLQTPKMSATAAHSLHPPDHAAYPPAMSPQSHVGVSHMG